MMQVVMHSQSHRGQCACGCGQPAASRLLSIYSLAQGPSGARLVMNQGIAFARTLRALDADDFRASKLGLAAAAMLFVRLGVVDDWRADPAIRIHVQRAFEYGHVIAVFPTGGCSIASSRGQSAIVHSHGWLLPPRFNRSPLIAPSSSYPHPPVHQSPIPTSATADVEISRECPQRPLHFER